jgi:hypothetical protein
MRPSDFFSAPSEDCHFRLQKSKRGERGSKKKRAQYSVQQENFYQSFEHLEDTGLWGWPCCKLRLSCG